MREINAPATITTTFQATAQAFQESMRNTGMLLSAMLVIYFVLVVLYESYIHPITILSGLPSAALGALLTLMLFGIDLNIYAIVGIRAVLRVRLPPCSARCLGIGAGAESRRRLGLAVVDCLSRR